MASAQETSRLISADKVEGTSVYDTSGDNVGTIKNVMIDKASGQVVYATMASGGLLGIGSDYFALPWNALKYNTSLGGYEVEMSRDKLEGAPAGSETEVISKLEDQSFGSKVYDYYGTKPYWQ
ncbi:MAG: PRC-barrel domain-containing protein [Rhodospirillales bacterium]